MTTESEDKNKGMNYEPNRIHWREGALVVHDMDAKCSAMLMLVVYSYISHQGERRCITIYLDQSMGKRGEWDNRMEVLHDPRDFKIQHDETEILSILARNWQSWSKKKRKRR